MSPRGKTQKSVLEYAQPRPPSPSRGTRRLGGALLSPFFSGDREAAAARVAAEKERCDMLWDAMDAAEAAFDGDGRGASGGSADGGGGRGGGAGGGASAGGGGVDGDGGGGAVVFLDSDGSGGGSGAAARRSATAARRRRASYLSSSDGSGGESDDFVAPKRVRVTVIPVRHARGQSASARKARKGVTEVVAAAVSVAKDVAAVDATQRPTPTHPSALVDEVLSVPTPPALSPERDPSPLPSPVVAPPVRKLRSRRPPMSLGSLFPEEVEEVAAPAASRFRGGRRRGDSGASSAEDDALLRPVLPRSARGGWRPARRDGGHGGSASRGSSAVVTPPRRVEREQDGGEQWGGRDPTSSARRRLRRVAPSSGEEGEGEEEEEESDVCGGATEAALLPKDDWRRGGATVVISLDSDSDKEVADAGRRRSRTSPRDMATPVVVRKFGSKVSRVTTPTPGRRTLPRSALQFDQVSVRRSILGRESDDDDESGDAGVGADRVAATASCARFSSNGVDDGPNMSASRASLSERRATTRKANETEPARGFSARRDSGSSKSQRYGSTVAADEEDKLSPIIVVRRSPKPAASVPEGADNGEWMNERNINDFSDSGDELGRDDGNLPSRRPNFLIGRVPSIQDTVGKARRRPRNPGLQMSDTRPLQSEPSALEEPLSRRSNMTAKSQHAVTVLDGDEYGEDGVDDCSEGGTGVPDQRCSGKAAYEREPRKRDRQVSKRSVAIQQAAKEDDNEDLESIGRLLELEEECLGDVPDEGAAESEQLPYDLDDTVVATAAKSTVQPPHSQRLPHGIGNAFDDTAANLGPPPYDIRAILCKPGESLVEMFHRIGEDAVIEAVFQAQGDGRPIVGGEELGISSTAPGQRCNGPTEFEMRFGQCLDKTKSNYTFEMGEAAVSGAKEKYKKMYEKKGRGSSTWKKKPTRGGRRKKR